jgi:hypothetical protein
MMPMPNVESDAQKLISSNIYTVDNQALKQYVVIDFAGRLSALEAACLAYRDLSPRGSFEEAAAKLFATLRWADDIPHATSILLPDVSPADHDGIFSEGPGPAVEDRIFRAASGQRRSLAVIQQTHMNE